MSVKRIDNNLNKIFTESNTVDTPKKFTELDDTPDDYTGESGKLISSNDTGDGIIFKFMSFTELDDTPDDYTGFADNLIMVNQTEDGVDFVGKHVLSFEDNTRMVFVQSNAPIGWTQDTSINDRMLRVVSGSGGGSGGTWDLSSLMTGDHTLTLGEMPEHTHTYLYSYIAGGPCENRLGPGHYTSYFDYVGGDQPHNHRLFDNNNWRPEYKDIIVCSKDVYIQ